MRVGLTHSRGALPGLPARLAACGLAVEWQPLVTTEPRDEAALVGEASRLIGCDWLVFPGRSAVDAWYGHALPALRAGPFASEAVDRLGRPRAEGGAALAVIGAGTAAALRDRGRPADLVGGGDALSTARALVAATRRGERVGLVQGALARPTLRAELERAGRDVAAATVYNTLTRPWSGEPADVTVFASPSAALAFGMGALRRTRPVAIGAVTLAALARLGLAATAAERPDVAAVAAAVEAAARAAADADRAAAATRGGVRGAVRP